MQIAHIFVLYIVVTVFHFHNGTFTTHITSELLHSALSSAVWSVYRSGDQSNPFSFWRHCNRKTSVRHAAWTRLRARHDVLHLLCRCLFLLQCLFGFVLLVVLRFHSNARFKWVAIQMLPVVFPFSHFERDTAQQSIFHGIDMVRTVTWEPLSVLKMGEKQWI